MDVGRGVAWLLEGGREEDGMEVEVEVDGSDEGDLEVCCLKLRVLCIDFCVFCIDLLSPCIDLLSTSIDLLSTSIDLLPLCTIFDPFTPGFPFSTATLLPKPIFLRICSAIDTSSSSSSPPLSLNSPFAFT